MITDDPRLTAYALNEMADADRAAFEADLAAADLAERAAIEAEIDSIRAVATTLASELRGELDAVAAGARVTVDERTTTDAPPIPIRRPRRAGRWMLAAAASVAVGGIVWSAFMPSMNRARETRSSDYAKAEPADRQANAGMAGEQRPGTRQTGPAIPGPLVYPAQLPDLSARREDVIARAAVSSPAKADDPWREAFGIERSEGMPEVNLRLPAADAATLDRAAVGNEKAADAAKPVGLHPVVISPPSDGSNTRERLARLDAAQRSLEVSMAKSKALADALRAKVDGRGKDQAAPDDRWQRGAVQVGAESYAAIHDNAFLDPRSSPLSTFGVDVDTASYANVRRFLEAGQRPPADAVRIEELVNYFPTSDPPPTDGRPFAVRTEVAACPWRPEHRLVRVALKGQVIARDQRPASNLVFLVGVSGSMNEPAKLPLVKRSLRKLVGQLGENDRVAIVVYASSSGLALPSTNASDKATILKAIDDLEAGGSTNGGQGITLAYATALERFIGNGGSNRVILCTDGDFNVGVTDRNELFNLIAEKAKAGVFLNVLGFGTGNLKDDTMEGLADKGNGQYAYVDGDREAEKVFVEQLGGRLVTIAKDVKLQLEFNPATVKSYRLIGYENRVMAAADFNNDLKDSGDLGAGHSVVALYEIEPALPRNPADAATNVDKPQLKYQPQHVGPVPAAVAVDLDSTELLTLKLRYKKPDAPLEQGVSELIEATLEDRADAAMDKASPDMRFAASVATFGMLLRESPHRGSASWEMVRGLARDGLADDTGGHRTEFLNLIDAAQRTRP